MSFENILETPDNFDSNSMLVRLVDAIGFRFYWATEGLSEEDFNFRASEDTMSIGELIVHIEELAVMCLESFESDVSSLKRNPKESLQSALTALEDLKTKLQKADQEKLSKIEIKGFPLWNMINGPLADALTHVGQINTLRRLAGNPCRAVSVFVGKPKSKK